MKSLKKAALIAALFAAGLPAASYADGGKKLNPWTDCGIGAMIFSDYPVLAVISNVIWDLGTTAVTSAGVSEQTCSGKNAKTAMFVNQTYASIEQDTVKGDGKHVRAMLNMMGCDNTAQAGLISAARADLASSMQNASYLQKTSSQKAEDYFMKVQDKASTEFAGRCQAF